MVEGPAQDAVAELRRYPIGHFDLFTGHWFDEVVGDQIAFLRRTFLDPQVHQSST